LLNDSIPKITTPYMRFYELEALCAMGEQSYVLKEMKDYWGGMLSLGATSFWEEYNPAKKGAEHYAMYGRPFGKSLCHAWGASPNIEFFRTVLGIDSYAPGFRKIKIEPHLGDLANVSGEIPHPNGKVAVAYTFDKDKWKIKIVLPEKTSGILVWKTKKYPLKAGENLLTGY